MNNTKFIYQLLEVSYIKSNGREVTFGTSNYDLFPNDWYFMNDFELKIQILKEAIEKNIKIIETDSYQATVEGLRKSL